MRVSKVLMTGFVVVMIAAFTFTMVGAQGEQPPAEDIAPPNSSIGVDAPVVPVSPYASIVYTRKPVFTFLKNFDAKAYQIQVREQSSATVVYTYKGSGTCNNYVCWLQPDSKLDMAGVAFNGIYEWRVNYKIGTMWHVYSPWVPFAVYKNKFNSTFDLNYKNWNNWYGPWTWNAAKGTIWTFGDAGGYYNSMYYSYYFPRFDYSVRMKRKINEWNTNAIVVWGNPWPETPDHVWREGYYIFYRNSKEVEIWKGVNGLYYQVLYIPDCDLVNPYGWNEIRVVGIYPYLDLWLNGDYLGYITLTDPLAGNYLGFDVFTNTPDQKFVVDWAKASVPDLAATMVHDPAMDLTMDPVEIVDPQQ